MSAIPQWMVIQVAVFHQSQLLTNILFCSGLVAEKNLNYPGLHKVNNLQPTAELRPVENQQTDETDLMPYAIIVEIERLAIRDRRSPLIFI